MTTVGSWLTTSLDWVCPGFQTDALGTSEATGLSRDTEGIAISPPSESAVVDVVNDNHRWYHIH